jgi:hypothetical protein
MTPNGSVSNTPKVGNRTKLIHKYPPTVPKGGHEKELGESYAEAAIRESWEEGQYLVLAFIARRLSN